MRSEVPLVPLSFFIARRLEDLGLSTVFRVDAGSVSASGDTGCGPGLGGGDGGSTAVGAAAGCAGASKLVVRVRVSGVHGRGSEAGTGAGLAALDAGAGG